MPGLMINGYQGISHNLSPFLDCIILLDLFFAGTHINCGEIYYFH